MKYVTKSLAVCLLFIIIAVLAASPAFPVQKNKNRNHRLHLTVRVQGEKPRPAPLKKQDFCLFIGDRPREILDVTEETASISLPPDFPGRNFILSFHTARYDKAIGKAISFFISDIVTPNDSLVLLTPLRVYNITVSANKGRMITKTRDLVQKDCISYRKNRNAAKKSLDIELKRMKRLFTGGVDDAARITSYKMIGTFLKTFPREFLDFRNRFLMPHLKKYRQVLDFLGSREGQRWWIHFQEGDMYGLTAGIKQITARIEIYCSQSSLARQAFAADLTQLQKLPELGDSFPAKQLSDAFTGKNTRYNAILRSSQKSGGTGTGIISHLEGLLKTVSRDTGGLTVRTGSPEQGMKKITEHRDRYYRLIYHPDGNIEEKKVQVIVQPADRKVKLSYKNHFSEEEVRESIRYLAAEKIRVADVSVKQTRAKRFITFVIEAIAFDKEKKFGLVKVGIELRDDQGVTVYRRENTLRSSGTAITISVPIPGQYTGSAMLSIRACDLIANRLASFEKQVRLEEAQ